MYTLPSASATNLTRPGHLRPAAAKPIIQQAEHCAGMPLQLYPHRWRREALPLPPAPRLPRVPSHLLFSSHRSVEPCTEYIIADAPYMAPPHVDVCPQLEAFKLRSQKWTSSGRLPASGPAQPFGPRRNLDYRAPKTHSEA